MKYALTLFVFFGVTLLSFGQVPVQINSGNPNFPFPQFSPYDFNGTHSLGNLATQNAPGFVHAEMEKIMREGWQIFANSFVYTGDSYKGIKLIKSNVGAPYDATEGVGYAMIAAAIMGDKTTFDGIWFREHDIRRATKKKYSDCSQTVRSGYSYGNNALPEPTGDSAMDGDMDAALGMVLAWKQWGDNSGYTDDCGNPISYKEEALGIIRGLVELYDRLGDSRRVTGSIGLDGYFKGGNTWNELTDWVHPTYKPEWLGPREQHIDYVSSGYFKVFSDFLSTQGNTPDDISWNIPQLKRAEASTAWINGQLLNTNTAIPQAGNVTVIGGVATFSSFNEGEDFRHAWREAMNYMWHGNPNITWNPTTHQIVNGTNSFEKDVATRMAIFVKDPTAAPWGNSCHDMGGGPDLTYKGASALMQQYNPNTGAAMGAFPLNWNTGTCSASAVVGQDYDLMAKLFQHCAIEWDLAAGGAGDRYLTSVPGYFHGWFRLLGMLVLSGNHLSPSAMKLEANMKIYESVNKTYLFAGDQVTYTFNYRNYASIDAQSVTIEDELPTGLIFVSASNGGTLNGTKVVWNLGQVKGFNSTNGVAPTQGSVTLICKVDNSFMGQICNSPTISTSNGKSWTANEYPNNVTEVMERNCIDVVKRALLIDKSVNYTKVQENTIVKFKIDFENSSTSGWINGGRPDVRFSYAQSATPANGDTRGIKIRLFHGAAEPYINYKNYRISAFLNDNTYNCVSGVGSCAVGWALRNTVYEGGDKTKVSFTQESITPGQDARGKWNQRVIIQFADQLATTTPHLSAHFGQPDRIHQGGSEPLRAVWDLYTSNYGAIDWSDDWSWDASAVDADGNNYFPVTNDCTDPNNLNLPVTSWHKQACELAYKTVDNVLIEEWDGYTWRRAYGNGPLPGRDVINVVIRDTLPLGLTFSSWVQKTALGIDAVYDPATRIITWTIPKLQVGQKGSIEYSANAIFSSAGSCPKADQKQINASWIEGDNESPKRDTVSVVVSCDPVILPPPPTSMTKVADKASYLAGDPITYSIEYEQTHGAIIDASMANAAEWNPLLGSLWTFGSELSNTNMNSPSLITHKKAHGTNGIITGSLKLTDNAAFSIALRHDGTTIADGSYITFKPNSGGGKIVVTIWNGNTPLITQTIGYPGATQNFKIELKADQLNLWMGTLTGSPTLTAVGLNVQAGYIGFVNGSPDGTDSYQTHSVLALHSEMDSGYDIVISDEIPAGLTFASASNAGTNSAGVISWPAVAGPVLYGTKILRTWTGAVASCSATGKIANTAYTNMLGQPTNSIGAQSVVVCGTVVTCVPPTTVTATPVSSAICLGSSITIDGTVSPANANYYYRWYKDGIAITTASQTYAPYKKTISTATDDGVYKLRVEDGNAGLSGCYKESATASIAVNAITTPGVIVGTQTICGGGNPVAFTLSSAAGGGDGTYNYVWERSSNAGATWTTVGGNTATFDEGVLTNATTSNIAYLYRRKVTSGACAQVTSNILTITVAVGVGAGTISADQTICYNTIPAEIKQIGAPSNIVGTPTYTWESSPNGTSSWTTITGATAISYTPTTAATTDIHIRRTITDPSTPAPCNTATSNTIHITVNPQLVAGVIGSNETTCANVATATITETTAPKGGTGTYTYQWQTSAALAGPYTNIASATSSTYNAGVLASTTYYQRVETSGICGSSTSNIITKTVTSSMSAGTISADQTICYNAIPGAIIQTGAPTNIVGTPTYIWESSPNGTSSWTTISGATASSYTPTAAITTDIYLRRTITDPGTPAPCNAATSNTIHITVNPQFVAGVIGSDETTCSNIPTTIMTATTPPTGGTGSYSYQWQSSSSLAGPYTNIATATSDTYNAGILASTTYFQRVETSGICGSATSNIITKTVNPVLVPAVDIAALPSTICAGSSVTFTATPTNPGTAPLYEWFINGTSQGAATSTATLTTTAITTSADVILVQLTSNALCATPATATKSMSITVNPVVVPAVTISATPTTICATGTTTFTATPTNPGVAPMYEWFINGASQGSPSSAANFTTTALTASTDVILVELTSNALCATPATATKNMTITVNASIGAGTIGTNQTICYNTTPAPITQSTVPTNIIGTPTYVWETSPNGTSSWSTIVGATGADYSPTMAITADVFIRRVITDLATPAPCNTATSNTVHITVNPQFVAGIIGSNESSCGNIATTIMVETSASSGGTGIYNYQWQSSSNYGGPFTNIASATNTSYDAGILKATTYFQRIETSGTCGSETSNIITKTITTPTAVSVSINNPGQTCAGSALNFTATSIGAGSTPTYQWFLGTTPIGTNSPNCNYTPALIDNGKIVSVRLSSSDVCNTGVATSSPITLDVVGSANPTITITTPNNPNCQGITTSFQATAIGAGLAASYQWFVNDSPVGSGISSYNASSLANQDRVRVELTSSLSCLTGVNPIKSNTIIMDVKPVPTPLINQTDKTVCSPNTFLFTSTVGTSTFLQWILNGNNIADATQSTYNASAGGSYTLLEDNGVCSQTSAPVMFTVIQPPVANAGTDIFLREGDTGNLNASQEDTYTWSPATYLSSTTISNPSFTATKTITYSLVITNTESTCPSAPDYVTVYVESPVKVTNTITLNSDGINDTWDIENIQDYPNATIEIFNRWGNIVWKSTGYSEKWNGSDYTNDEPLPDGTYFYVINLNSQYHKEPYSGYVQIVR